ncbi:MAG TPA: PKD domain-containing protein [Thermoanaerobaculia bacterium]|nr:PKD domain-containing protein [Thermoanaerobaculia bacterium]
MALFAAAAPAAPKPPAEEKELIVLLSPDVHAPSAEEVVDKFRNHQPLPGSLGTGSPTDVRFGITERAKGPLRDEIEVDRDSPRGRLERYIVLRYPASANLDSIRRSLLKDPNVVAVQDNASGQLSATPNDPLFPSFSGAAPYDYQWGSQTLNLPSAWDYTTGHAYVGLIDTGIDPSHPDLVDNFRPQLSRDFGYDDANVDEAQTQGGLTPTRAGHGTHVAGIVGARGNNGQGVAGACWECSLLVAKMTTLGSCGTNCVANQFFTEQGVANALNGLVDRGAQVANMSFRTAQHDCAAEPANVICTALAYAAQRDLLLVAASGNNGGPVDFPARDSRVLAVGGLIPNGSFWGTCSQVAPWPDPSPPECPSSSGPEQDVVAPARQVLSTFYRNFSHIPGVCGETTAGSGYGVCTGTSMSTPFTAGLIALVRSANPLLSKSDVEAIVRSTASGGGIFQNNQVGYGTVNASAAVQAALGRVNAAVLPNRLTPLFSFYSSPASDFFYTTVPQMATAAEGSNAYEPTGPSVPGYNAFPGAPVPCTGCRIGPGASVYVFTGDRAPFSGAPPLAHLYRLTRVGTAPEQDATYAIDNNEVNYFRGLGYNLDGIEGYLYSRCTPEPGCIPADAVKLGRAYNSVRGDWAIFPESELSTMQAAGYAFQPGILDWIGYVYPNTDADNDQLIDGFERLIGTSAAVADTDCDGTSDGNEILHYPYSDPRGTSQCDQPPVAQFIAACGGFSCLFDGTDSTDDHNIVSWAWAFGDGSTGTGSTTSHVYATVGTFTVTLTVTDDAGHTNSTSQTVHTTQDDPPYASFYVVCNGRTCSADAEGSTDDVGIVNYTWTWGDGQTTSGGSSFSAPSHTYAASGTYTITLVVTDARNQTATTSHAVTVSVAPTASFTISCVGRRCDVDASASTGDGGIASYTWDWDDESSSTTTVPTTYHIYPFPGTYTVHLVVTDVNGNTAGATQTVSVETDDPPTANFYVVCNGLQCTADSEASGDDWGIVNYTWTWGDGQTTSGGSDTSAPQHTYASAGTYTITLVVRDYSDQTATDSHSVTVTAGGPVASFTINCVGRSCDVNASASGPNIADYLWDWDDEGLTETSSATAHHNYPYGGTFVVRLTVTDGNGSQAASSQTITVP